VFFLRVWGFLNDKNQNTRYGKRLAKGMDVCEISIFDFLSWKNWNVDKWCLFVGLFLEWLRNWIEFMMIQKKTIPKLLKEKEYWKSALKSNWFWMIWKRNLRGKGTEVHFWRIWNFVGFRYERKQNYWILIEWFSERPISQNKEKTILKKERLKNAFFGNRILEDEW